MYVTDNITKTFFTKNFKLNMWDWKTGRLEDWKTGRLEEESLPLRYTYNNYMYVTDNIHQGPS